MDYVDDVCDYVVLLIEVILNLLIAAFKFMLYNCDVTLFPLFVYFAVHFILKVRHIISSILILSLNERFITFFC